MTDAPENFKQDLKTCFIADFIVKQSIDVYDGQELDTTIEINGSIVVSSETRNQFIAEFESLCEKHRI